MSKTLDQLRVFVLFDQEISPIFIDEHTPNTNDSM